MSADAKRVERTPPLWALDEHLRVCCLEAREKQCVLLSSIDSHRNKARDHVRWKWFGFVKFFEPT